MEYLSKKTKIDFRSNDAYQSFEEYINAIEDDNEKLHHNYRALYRAAKISRLLLKTHDDINTVPPELLRSIAHIILENSNMVKDYLPKPKDLDKEQ